jgi:TonB-linked SusC/RagA family outer membrane protein
MKRLLFLAICFALNLAVMAQSADVRLSMKFDNEALPQALLRLEQSTGYKFLFTYDDIQSYHVSGEMKNAKLFDIVNFLLKGKPLEYSVDGKFVNITLKNEKKSPKGKMQSVGGYVVDESGEPVVGAIVKVVGTDVLAATDLNGAFHFEYYLSGNHQVQVSFIGMKTETVALQREMKITLKEDNMMLQDVVVTGIFSKPKESFTGSVANIGREQLDIYKGSNLLQTLKSIDASINFGIDNLNGSNPNNLPNITIRGGASLPTNVQEFNQGIQNDTNAPLIIMDGFEITLTKLMDYNDDEIESINILKDAAATAIYGSRGANGVIVVMSKRPEPGSLKVNIEAGTTIELPDLSSYNLLNAAQKLQLEFDAGLYDRPNNPTSQLSTREVYNQRLRSVLSGTDTDWLSKPVRTGVGQDYKARFEGGSEEFRWGASLGWKDIEGAMKGSRRKTFNGGITLMYNLKNLVFRNYTAVTVNNSEESPYGSFSTYAQQQPYNAPYDENGRLVRAFPSFLGGSTTQNPLYDANLNWFDQSGYQNITNNFSIDWNILPELRLRGQIGISTQQNTSDYFLPAEHSYFADDAQYESDEGFLRRGLYRYGTGRTTTYDGELTLSYNKTFMKKHQLYAGLNYSINQNNSYHYLFTVEGFSSDEVTSIMNGRQYAQNSKPSGTKALSRMLGLTGNINYSYDNRYFADCSYRFDGSSEYGSDKKWAPFFSVGAGWNIHNERFLKTKWLNNLKLRASYGETGSQLFSNSGAFTAYQHITNNKYANWVGAQLIGLGNPDLTWQKTTELNFGIEWGLWNDRLKGSFDWYRKTTSNLLSFMNLPLSSGFASYMANIGEVRNQGWELSMSGYIVRNAEKHINWIVSGQLVYNKNEISKLSEAIKQQNDEYLKQSVDVSSLFFEGYPQNAIYAVRSLGIDPSTGQELFLDRNGELTTTWDAGDKVYCGSAEPLYRGNIGSTLIWGKFTFNLSFSYYWGGYAYNQTLIDKVEVTKAVIQQQNVDERVLSERWFNPGDVTFFKRLSNEATHATSRYVMRDNVLQLQSAGIQYRWDNDWIRKAIHCNAVIFALNVNDLLYFGSIKRERGTTYPYSRNVLASVKLSF